MPSPVASPTPPNPPPAGGRRFLRRAALCGIAAAVVAAGAAAGVALLGRGDDSDRTSQTPWLSIACAVTDCAVTDCAVTDCEPLSADGAGLCVVTQCGDVFALAGRGGPAAYPASFGRLRNPSVGGGGGRPRFLYNSEALYLVGETVDQVGLLGTAVRLRPDGTFDRAYGRRVRAMASAGGDVAALGFVPEMEIGYALRAVDVSYEDGSYALGGTLRAACCGEAVETFDCKAVGTRFVAVGTCGCGAGPAWKDGANVYISDAPLGAWLAAPRAAAGVARVKTMVEQCLSPCGGDLALIHGFPRAELWSLAEGALVEAIEPDGLNVAFAGDARARDDYALVYGNGVRWRGGTRRMTVRFDGEFDRGGTTIAGRGRIVLEDAGALGDVPPAPPGLYGGAAYCALLPGDLLLLMNHQGRWCRYRAEWDAAAAGPE